MSTPEANNNAETQVTEVSQDEQTQVEQVQEQAQEEQAAAPSDDAAFEAGFHAAQGTEPPAQAPKQEEPEPEPKPSMATITEEELNDLRARAAEVDKLKEQQAKVFGSLGSLKQSLDALRNQLRPTATQVQITKDKLARLSQSFPEMAEMIAEDLNGVLSGAGAASVDTSQFEQNIETKINERLQQAQQQFEAKVLGVMHPDWRQVVPSQEFQQWKETLPEDVREELNNSWDAEFIGSKLTEFKGWKNKLAESQKTKQRRLESAITPKGAAAAPAITDEDAFYAGFKEARGMR